MSNPSLEDEEPMQRRHPEPHAPFPVSQLLILALGAILFLLVISLGFNAWLFFNPDVHFDRGNQARRAEELARQQQIQAADAQQRTAILQQEAQRKEAAMRRDIEDLTRQLEAAREQLEDAKRAKRVDPEEQAAQPAWGTLEGRVYYADVPPAPAPFPVNAGPVVAGLLAQAQKKGLPIDGLRINPQNDGVADVFVFLKRPKDGVLPIHDDDKKRKDSVIIDAPLCMFEPRNSIHYPEWFDGKNREKTGQKLITKNSSPVGQNHRMITHPKYNEAYNRNLPRTTGVEYKLNPQPLPVIVQDDIHIWMKAHVLILDHPYYAITKEDGSFTIPRVPAGMEVQVMAWHESKGWLFGKDGKTMTLKHGKNKLDEFDMSAK